jgi:hypothetical protein
VKTISLPLLQEDVSLLEGLRVAGENRCSGVVTTDGKGFKLHRYDDLVEALDKNREELLKLADGQLIDPITATEIEANGLDLIFPNADKIDRFLSKRGETARIAAVSDNPRGIGGTANLLLRGDFADVYIAVVARLYRCSIGFEVVDEDKLPPSRNCRKHLGGKFNQV